jgi:DNA-directed RNA polymerase specialized sigma24 family protein
MGLFRRKKYASEHSVNESFSKMKSDISLLNQWVHYLKGNHDHLRGRHEAHATSVEIKHASLHNHVQSLREENGVLKERMRQMMEYMKLLHGEVKQLHEEVHARPAIPEPMLTNEQPALEESVQESAPEPIPEAVIVAAGLTPAEKRLLSTMYSAEAPLTYAEISGLVGISYGTAKNRIMRIKQKGIDLKFSTDLKGERKFWQINRPKHGLHMRDTHVTHICDTHVTRI